MKRIGIMLLITVIILSGCGVSAVELTEQEQTAVAHYAAKTLLKHDKSYNDGIVKMNMEEVDEEAEILDPIQNQPTTDETVSIPEDGVVEGESPEVADVEAVKTYVSVNEAMGMLDYSFEYSGYEIRDSYLEEDYFSLNATQGKTFLVLKFKITNVSSEQECDILSKAMKFKAILDGGKSVMAQSTILLNDLSTYQYPLAIGESAETVLLFEIPVENSGFAGSIELTVKQEEEVINVLLQ